MLRRGSLREVLDPPRVVAPAIAVVPFTSCVPVEVEGASSGNLTVITTRKWRAPAESALSRR